MKKLDLNYIIEDKEYNFLIILVRYILIKKYSAKLLALSEDLFEYLLNNKNEINYNKLIVNIRKNKLVNFIDSEGTIYKLFPECKQKLLKIKNFQKIGKLSYISSAIEISKILNEGEIPFIILKGIALSDLIYDDLYFRYSNDIDIFIDKKNLIKTTNLFLNNGLMNLQINKKTLNNRKILNYIKWVDYSFKFYQNSFDRPFEIDLHWELAYLRRNMPNFIEAWTTKSLLNIEGTNFYTLSPLNHFIHLCAHSAKDGWMIIRDLVEIYLLARKIPSEKIDQLKKIKFVKNSIFASNYIVNGNKEVLIDLKSKKVIMIANMNQRLPNRYLQNKERNFLIYFRNFYDLLILNMELSDKVRSIAHKLLRPDLLFLNNKQWPLIFIFIKRLKRLIKRFL